MLFDEPTSALDPELVGEVLEVMRDLAEPGHDDDRRDARDGLRPRGRRPRRLHGRRGRRRAGQPKESSTTRSTSARSRSSSGCAPRTKRTGEPSGRPRRRADRPYVQSASPRRTRPLDAYEAPSARRCGHVWGHDDGVTPSRPRLPDHEIPTPRGRRAARHLSPSGSQRTVRAAYDNVPHYRAALRRQGFPPRRPAVARRPRRLPFTTKADLRDNYPFGMFAVPREQVVRVHASSGTTGRPTVVGYTRATSTRGPTSWRARSALAGGRPGDIVHVAYGYGLFTGGLGAHYGAERLGGTVVPVSGGMTERQVQLIQDFAARHHGDAVLLPQPRSTRWSARASTRADDRLRGRHLRRRAVDRVDAPGDRAAHRHGRGRHLRPLGGHGPRRRAGGRDDEGRAAHLGGPLLPRDHRPDHRGGAARRRGRRARLHLADQGGHAGDPLPHPRPDPAAPRHGGARRCAGWRRSPAAPTT